MTRPPVISDTKTHLLFHSRQSASDAQLVLRVGRRIWQWFTAPLRWCVILPSVMLIALVTVSACMAVTHASAPAHEFKARLIVTFFFGMLIIMAAMIPVGIAIRAKIKRIQRADYCPCMQCGYRLIGLPRHSRCPECGTAHDVVRLQLFWKGRSFPQGNPNNPIARRALYITVSNILLISALFYLINLLPNPHFHSLIAMPCLVLLLLGPSIWMHLDFRKRFMRYRFALCRNCGFDLHQHPPRGTCPKCGTEYEKRELREYWKERWPVNWERDVLVPAMRAERLLSVLEQKEQEQQYKVACNKA